MNVNNDVINAKSLWAKKSSLLGHKAIRKNPIVGIVNIGINVFIRKGDYP